jgi:hypothetical protein
LSQTLEVGSKRVDGVRFGRLRPRLEIAQPAAEIGVSSLQIR